MDWNVVPPPAVLTGLPMGRAGQMAAKQKELWCHQRLGDHVAVFCCGTRLLAEWRFTCLVDLMKGVAIEVCVL